MDKHAKYSKGKVSYASNGYGAMRKDTISSPSGLTCGEIVAGLFAIVIVIVIVVIVVLL